jgi:hypothetical protein
MLLQIMPSIRGLIYEKCNYTKTSLSLSLFSPSHLLWINNSKQLSITAIEHSENFTLQSCDIFTNFFLAAWDIYLYINLNLLKEYQPILLTNLYFTKINNSKCTFVQLVSVKYITFLSIFIENFFLHIA